MSDNVFRIDCGYQNYDWGKIGSSSAVAQFASASNPTTVVDETKPYAELWMGTHPSVPSIAVNNGKDLRDLVGSSPQKLLHQSVIDKFGSAKELPFLFKVLSIKKVLSIQAHPDKALAARLHAEDPKNYPDDNHKPEMAIAVTAFEGFCGFKPLAQLATTLKTIPEFHDIVGDELAQEFISGIVPEAKEFSNEDLVNKKLLKKLFEKVMTAEETVVATKAAALVKRAAAEPQVFDSINEGLAELIGRLNEQFPNDIGLFCGCLMLNHTRLLPGEAMYLQANCPHAYISGDIIECMAASDNVVRSGFTPKFKDVPNLVEMLTYTYDSVEKQKMPLLSFDKSRGEAARSVLYNPPIDEFAVLQTIFDTKAGQKQEFDGFLGPSILIATNGNGQLKETSTGKLFEVKRGYVYFIAPETPVELISISEDAPFTSYRAFVEA